MKSLVWLIVLLSISGLMFALNGNIAVSNHHTDVILMSNTPSGLNVNYTVGNLDYREVNTPGGNFTDINIGGYANTNLTGLPKLPLLRKIIRVPLQAEIVPVITQSHTETVSLAGMGINYPVLPRQESVAKNQDPTTVPFIIDNNFYNGTQWTDYPSIKVEEIGMLRGARLVALDFTPVRYNPASARLEVITSASVQVNYLGADWAATTETYERYYSPAFESVLAQTVYNYEPSRTSLDRYPLGMIIIAPANYETYLQPYIDWKTHQGYDVTFANTTTTGTTTTSIKTYIQNIWNAATTENPAPSYLILVGDTAQIPAWNGSTSGGHVTDLNYVRLQGTDFVPEMYFGRFSAQTVAQVQTYVEKSLQYEMYEMPDPSYLSYTDLIAGADSYYAPTHGNGQINYGKNNYFNESTAPDWTPHGPYNIRNRMYLYPASASSDATVLADMSAGLGFINYTAHGSETSWADPTVTVSNIYSMTNADKYFVAIGNCCLTNAFDTNECFGEALTRTANKGAVAYVGGTNSTYWDEDYYWAVGYKPPVVGTGSPYIDGHMGAYDALFHYHNEAFADWASTMGSMNFMGNMAVVQANSSRQNYYWEIYSIMGDPSLIPYMGIPTPINAVYNPTVQMGVGTMQITTDPYTYVAVSKDNVLHGTGLADASGNLTLTFEPFTTPGTAQIVMTRSLRQPLIADIQVTSTAGPYILINSLTVNDGNNSIAEAGETLYLDLIMNNVGTVAAQNVTATLTTDNQYVNIIDGSFEMAQVPVNEQITVDQAFEVAIMPYIPDQENVEFTIEFTDGNDTWTSTRTITVNAPDISISSPTFYDPNNNGAFEQGEMITISFTLANTGHMNAPGGELDIVINTDDATPSQDSFTLPAMNTGVNIPLNFQVTIAQDAQTGTIIPIGLAYTAGGQMVNSMIAMPVGAVAEGFESGGFNSFAWNNTSTIPWTIVSGTTNAHTGNYAARSGAIGNNGITDLSLEMNVGMDSEISFWRKVSTESGYDFLRFYIDNTEMGSWSGSLAWLQLTYPVTAGTHTFKWTYQKDYSSTGGSDTVWIDDIVFPMSGDASVPIFFLPVTSLSFNIDHLNILVSQDLILRNLGSAELTGTITVPEVVGLLFNGTEVADTYNYSIPPGENGIFTISLYPTSQINLNDNITFTSNDPANPAYAVTLHIETTTSNDDSTIPPATKLEGNYPNPFNPETTIRYAVKEPGQITIRIYNSKGQLVRTLVDERMKAGNHRAVWNGKDDNGKAVSSGLYLYRMQASGFNQTRKMMLMK